MTLGLGRSVPIRLHGLHLLYHPPATNRAQSRATPRCDDSLRQAHCTSTVDLTSRGTRDAITDPRERYELCGYASPLPASRSHSCTVAQSERKESGGAPWEVHMGEEGFPLFPRSQRVRSPGASRAPKSCSPHRPFQRPGHAWVIESMRGSVEWAQGGLVEASQFTAPVKESHLFRVVRAFSRRERISFLICDSL